MLFWAKQVLSRKTPLSGNENPTISKSYTTCLAIFINIKILESYIWDKPCRGARICLSFKFRVQNWNWRMICSRNLVNIVYYILVPMYKLRHMKCKYFNPSILALHVTLCLITLSGKIWYTKCQIISHTIYQLFVSKITLLNIPLVLQLYDCNNTFVSVRLQLSLNTWAFCLKHEMKHNKNCKFLNIYFFWMIVLTHKIVIICHDVLLIYYNILYLLLASFSRLICKHNTTRICQRNQQQKEQRLRMIDVMGMAKCHWCV